MIFIFYLGCFIDLKESFPYLAFLIFFQNIIQMTVLSIIITKVIIEKQKRAPGKNIFFTQIFSRVTFRLYITNISYTLHF